MSRKKLFVSSVLAVIAVVCLSALTVVLLLHYVYKTPQSQMQQVVARVGRHVLLPTDETPALATVTDYTKLKNNKFLSEGRNGDQILIYAKWGKAVIYSPNQDRIVDIGPVDVSPPGGDSSGFQSLGSQ